MSTGQRAVMLCDWGVKAGMMLFAGNTVWSISERVRGVCVDALYKSTFTLFRYLQNIAYTTWQWDGFWHIVTGTSIHCIQANMWVQTASKWQKCSSKDRMNLVKEGACLRNLDCGSAAGHGVRVWPPMGSGVWKIWHVSIQDTAFAQSAGPDLVGGKPGAQR